MLPGSPASDQGLLIDETDTGPPTPPTAAEETVEDDLPTPVKGIVDDLATALPPPTEIPEEVAVQPPAKPARPTLESILSDLKSRQEKRPETRKVVIIEPIPPPALSTFEVDDVTPLPVQKTPVAPQKKSRERRTKANKKAAVEPSKVRGV